MAASARTSSSTAGSGPVYRCTPRLLLRQQPDGIEILSKADWAAVGRARISRRGQIDQLIIVPRARRQGLATEFWRALSEIQRPTAIDLSELGADDGAAAWLQSLGWRAAPEGYQPPQPSDHLPPLDFAAFQIQRARFWAQQLKLPRDYGTARGLALVSEPEQLELAGVDCFARPLYLAPDAASAWRRLQSAAAADDINLQAVSGFRGIDYQGQLLRKKLAAEANRDELLRVSAAPGYSEHHSGFALDLTSPDLPPLETVFADSPAFAWLSAHAASLGFVMSFPADNPHQLAFEPWHWRFEASPLNPA